MEEKTEKNINLQRYLSFLIPLLLAMAIIISFSIVITRRHTEWKTVLSKKETLQKELAQLQKENLELHELRDCLLYDPVQIEKEAREQLGYSRPEEVIYKNPELSDSQKETKKNLPTLSITNVFTMANLRKGEPSAKADNPLDAPLSKASSNVHQRLPKILLEKAGLAGFFVVIIIITVGFFSFTYWYENKRNQIDNTKDMNCEH